MHLAGAGFKVCVYVCIWGGCVLESTEGQGEREKERGREEEMMHLCMITWGEEELKKKTQREFRGAGEFVTMVEQFHIWDNLLQPARRQQGKKTHLCALKLFYVSYNVILYAWFAVQ